MSMRHLNAFELLRHGAPPGSSSTKKRKKRRKKRSGKGGVGAQSVQEAETRDTVISPSPDGDAPASSSPAASDVASEDTTDLGAKDNSLLCSAAGTGLDVSEDYPAPLDPAEPADGFTAVKTRKKKKDRLAAPTRGQSFASSASSEASFSDVTGGSDWDGVGSPTLSSRQSANGTTAVSEVSSVVSSEPPSSVATSVSVASPARGAPAPLGAYEAPERDQHLRAATGSVATAPVAEPHMSDTVERATDGGNSTRSRELAERDALDAEIEAWDPAGPPKALNAWSKRIHREQNDLLKKRFQNSVAAPQVPPFWAMFSDLNGLERVAAKALAAGNRAPFAPLRRLFFYCMYGSEDLHTWLLDRLRSVSTKMNNDARDRLITLAVRAVSILKIPCRPPELRSERLVMLPYDADEPARNVWSELDSSFEKFAQSRSRFSSLQYEMARYAPTEDFRHRFEEAMGDLHAMIAEFDSTLEVEAKRKAANEQHKQSWKDKNESEVRPLVQRINDLQKDIDADRQRKVLLQQEIARIDSQIEAALRNQDRAQNEVNEWRTEIQTRVNRIVEEDQSMEASLQRQAQDLASAKDLQEVLQSCCERLSTESQSKVDQFASAQLKQTTVYFDALSLLMTNYASFREFYNHRVSELRDILQKSEQQQQRAIAMGLPAAAATSSLEPIRLSIKQGLQLVSDASREVEALMKSTKSLVNDRDPAFIEFIKGLPSNAFDLLPSDCVPDAAARDRSNGAAIESPQTTEQHENAANAVAAVASFTATPAPVATSTQPAPSVSPLITAPARPISRGSEYLANAPSPSPAHAQHDWASRSSSADADLALTGDFASKKPSNPGRGPANPRTRASRSSRSSRGRNGGARGAHGEHTDAGQRQFRPVQKHAESPAVSPNGVSVPVPDRRVGGAVTNGHRTSITPIGSRPSSSTRKQTVNGGALSMRSAWGSTPLHRS